MEAIKETSRLLTSTEVARAFGVGVSSVKRWTDDGTLSSIRTVGGHRRYSLLTVHEFAERQGLAVDHLPPVPERWLAPEALDYGRLHDAILKATLADDASALYSTVRAATIQCRDYGELFDLGIGRAMATIGALWNDGQIGVEQEHRATHAIADALQSVTPPVDSGAVALLAAPPGERHDLPLRMIRIVLAHHGWRTDYLGGDVPWESLSRAISRTDARLVLLTSRESDSFSAREFTQLSGALPERVTLGIGGNWARGGRAGDSPVLRFRSIRGFDRWLRSSLSPRPSQQQ